MVQSSVVLASDFNIPPQPTRLIDRDAELARLGELLARHDIRLLTLTGPGGVGKTRLAIAAALQMRHAFPHGAWFVDLAPLSDPELVLPTIARVIGVREQRERDLADTLAAFLRPRRALLVVDNLEHLLGAVPCLDALAAACPDLTILVTSREPMQLRREQVVAIHPLPVPEAQHSSWPMADLEKVPAIALFVARAQAADMDFGLHSGNVAAVVELSRRLDGLPLAMELAAARTRLLPPTALLAKLEHGLGLLRWDAPDLPPRHRTLHATLDWSYGLLNDAERAVFRRLGVFAGGFTLEAVAAVAVTDDPHAETLDIVQGLVDKHLVRAIASVLGEPRFGLLATVREYALERLAESGEAEATRDRHLTYSLTLAEQADRAMLTEEELAWLTRLDHEIDNFRQAHKWAITRGDAEAEWRFVAALWYFWVHRGALREGRAWSTAALTRRFDADALLRARFFEGVGLLDIYAGDDARATVNLTESVAAAKDLGEAAMTARMLGSLGIAVYAQGDPTRARAIVIEMLSLARAAHSRRMVGEAFFFLAMFTVGPGGNPQDWPQLQIELNEGIACLREAGFLRGLAITLACQARLLSEVDAPAAGAPLREALELARVMDDPLAIGLVPWLSLVMLAPRLPADQLALMSGGITTLASRSVALGGRSLIELFGSSADHASLAQAVADAKSTLGDERFTAAQAAGSVLTFEELVDNLLAALAAGTTPGPVEAAPRRAQVPEVMLSPREYEVLALLVQGLSDREIATRLHISRRTVGGHVTHLLGKLGVHSRTAAVTFALRHRLVESPSSPTPTE
jgi:non-specific serine/threonine protein kinase